MDAPTFVYAKNKKSLSPLRVFVDDTYRHLASSSQMAFSCLDRQSKHQGTRRGLGILEAPDVVASASLRLASGHSLGDVSPLPTWHFKLLQYLVPLNNEVPSLLSARAAGTSLVS